MDKEDMQNSEDNISEDVVALENNDNISIDESSNGEIYNDGNNIESTDIQHEHFENLDQKFGEHDDSVENTDQDIQAIYDVPVQLCAVIGRATMPVHQLLKLGHGAVIELDRKIGEEIDLYVNNRLVARGELISMDDRIGVSLTEIIKCEH